MLHPDWLNHIVPFALATGKQPSWNLQRILEALVIALLTSYATMYAVQKQMETDIANIRASIAEIKSEGRDMRNAIVAREDRIEAKLDNHISASGRR